jgi:hypothetical protein
MQLQGANMRQYKNKPVSVALSLTSKECLLRLCLEISIANLPNHRQLSMMGNLQHLVQSSLIKAQPWVALSALVLRKAGERYIYPT